MRVIGSPFSSDGSCIDAAEGCGSSDGVEYTYALSTHLWYGVYEVTVYICAVRVYPSSLPQWRIHRSMFDKDRAIFSNNFIVGDEKW